jgi:uncharacterized protein YbjQ (UPF0145 family)
MQISDAYKLDDSRPHHSIGRIRAAAAWRAVVAVDARADRFAAIEVLIREAQEYGADAIIGLEFHIDEVKRAGIEGADLQRVAVTGIAVRFAEGN